MYYLFLVLLIISVDSFDVGFIQRQGPDDNRNVVVMKQYFSNVTVTKGTEIKLFDCNITNSVTASDCLNQLVVQKIKLIYSFCDRDILELDNKIMEENDIIIWCVNTYNIGKCLKHYVMGNSLIPVLNSCIFLLIFSIFSAICCII